MSDIETTPERTFVHTSRAWYGQRSLHAESLVDEVVFGAGCDAAMCWSRLGSSDGSPTARLEIFSDSWRVFADTPDLFADLARSGPKGLSPAAFCTLLRRHGHVDVTPTEQDDADPPDPDIAALQAVRSARRADAIVRARLQRAGDLALVRAWDAARTRGRR